MAGRTANRQTGAAEERQQARDFVGARAPLKGSLEDIKRGSHVFFIPGFSKNEKQNVSQSE